MSTPALRVEVEAPSGASWTPPAGRCLEADREYVWYVRGTDAFGRPAGNWSAARRLRVAGAASPEAETATADPSAGEGRFPGGGIPAVLEELGAIQEQLADHQAEIGRRMDAIDAQLADLDADLFAHAESVKPCTPERWRDGKCRILQVKASVCFGVDLGADLRASWALQPGMEIAAGGSWHEVPHVELKAKLQAPLLAGVGPAQIAVPSVQGGLGAGAGGGLQVCVADLTIPLDGEAAARGSDPFAEQLVQALELQAGAITERITDLLDERGLDGSRMAETLQALRAVRGGGQPIDDPSEVLSEGPLRELIDTLPIDGELAALVADPAPLLPRFDPENPLEICEEFGSGGLLGGNAAAVCGFVDSMPDLVELADRVENLPTQVTDQICDSIPFDECGTFVSKAECRRGCRSQARSCKNQCGPFQFACRRDCETRKDACVACCNTASDPGACEF